MITLNKRLIRILIGVVVLLLIPLVAMQFTSEVNWGVFDFIVMGTLLLVTGFGCEQVLRKVNKRDLRIALLTGIVVLFLLIWVELAVGIFGTPFAGS